MTAKHNLRRYINEQTKRVHSQEFTSRAQGFHSDIDFGGDLDWAPDKELDAFCIKEESVMTTCPATWKLGIFDIL